MITYKERQVPKIGLVVDVFLGNGKSTRKTGTIYRVPGGWQYQVSKKHLGEVLPSIDDVKKSLEAD